MNRRTTLEVSIPTSTVGFTVDSAYGGAGAAVPNTTPSRRVKIRNNGGRSFEYRVDGGAWIVLGMYQTVELDVNLADSEISVRQSLEPGADDPTGQLEIEALDFDVEADGEPVPLPGSGLRRVAGDVVVTEDDVAVSFTNTVAPAAKRNVTLPAERVDGRQIFLLPDGGDQAFTVDGNGKSVVLASATGAAVTELANAAKTVMWSDALDKWLAW